MMKKLLNATQNEPYSHDGSTHSSKMHFRLKVPSGEYGSIFVAFKRFFIMPVFQVENIFATFRMSYEIGYCTQ